VFRQQAIDTVAGIARLYTDLVSLNEDVKVKREALRSLSGCMRTTRTKFNKASRRRSR
jgi:outer membrane protein TolC